MSISRSSLIGAVKLVAGIAIVVWLVWSNHDVLDAINGDSLKPGLLLAGGLILLLAIAVSFVRWWSLVTAAGLTLRLSDALLMGFVGYAFNLLLPGSVGGDVVKSVMIARRQSRRVTAVTTIVMDRVIGLLGLVILTALVGGGWILFGQPEPKIKAIALATCLFLPVVVFALYVLFNRRFIESKFVQRLGEHPKLGSLVSGVTEAIQAYRSRPQAIAVAIGLTFIGQSLLVFGIWVVGVAIYPVAAPLASHFLLMPLGLSAGGIPLTPGGLGVLDVAVVELYKLGGNDPSSAVAMIVIV